MTVAARDHFVYRIYNADGQLLYIGCTRRPEQRWQQHRSERPAVVLAAARWKLQGPFVKEKAFKVEAAAIWAERPLFNAERLGGLTRSDQVRLNIIAAHKLGIRTPLPPSCPARDILVEEGLIEASA